jgi:hypothetical protein
MRHAVKVNIRNRVLIFEGAKTRKRLGRTLASEDQIVEKFNGILSSVLQKNNIKFGKIYKNSKQYLTLKEISKEAQNFCVAFNLQELEVGFQIYIECGLSILKHQYSIYRLLAVNSKILTQYTNILTLENDPYKENTIKIYQAWKSALSRYHHMDFDVEDPDKKVVFIYARECADSIKANYQDFIDAQFDKWSYLESVPELSQLYGENAKLIYQKYMATQRQKYQTDEEQIYFKKIHETKEIPLTKDKPKRSAD